MTSISKIRVGVLVNLLASRLVLLGPDPDSLRRVVRQAHARLSMSAIDGLPGVFPVA